MAPTVRMVDVARLAGVSTMTVSRVLNDGPNVTETVRKRVLAAVNRLQYQPNELARSLREKRSRQIGIIVPYLSDPFFAMCAHVMGAVAVRHSYSVVLATSNEDPDAEFDEASRMLRRNVDGLIVVPAHGSRLTSAQFSRMPIVAVDRPLPGDGIDTLLVENKRGALLGTEHLIQLGHQRITFIGLTDDLFTMKTRHAGYNQAMKRARLTPNALTINTNQQDTIRAVKALLKQRRPPTAFFCANNLSTRDVLHTLQTLDLHPPEGVALVGFDDFETADLIPPGITVVRQPVEELGRCAAEMLFDRIQARTRRKAPRHTTLPVELIVRGSCGARA